MNNSIAKSLATIRSIESNETLNESAVAAPAAAVAGKGIGRFIPGVGAALGAYDAYGRAKQGDWAGAGLSAAGGLAGLIPGIGTAASIGIAGAQALRDKQRTGSYLPGTDEIAAGVAKDAAELPTQTAAVPTPPGGDPKVFALQQQLIAKGAKIKADGKMGTNTQTAMKQFPNVKMAEQFKGTTMSEAQKIAELRDRLAQLESTQQVDEISLGGIGSAIKSGASSVGNFFKGAKAGMQGGAAASNVASGAANLGKAGEKGMAAAGALKGAATSNAAKNIAKVGAGAAVGAAGMAALGGGAATKPADPATPTKPKVPGATTAPAAGQTPNTDADPADVAALNAMAADLENSQDPADIELLKRYNGIINAINNAAPGEKRTAGQVAANAELKAAGT